MSGSICFTETMRGRLSAPPRAINTLLELVDLKVDISARAAQGTAGMVGAVSAGYLLVPGLYPEPLAVQHGRIEILRQTAEHACEMRYDMLCINPASKQRLRLLGVKHVDHHSGLFWPRAIWRETTTLQVQLFALPNESNGSNEPDEPNAVNANQAAGATALASGVVTIHPADFVRQLLSFRSLSPLGFRAAWQNLCGFLRFFVGRLAGVYKRR